MPSKELLASYVAALSISIANHVCMHRVLKLWQAGMFFTRISRPGVFVCPTVCKAMYYRRPLPSTCVDFSSDEGKRLFSKSLSEGGMETYFKLGAQFRTQDEPAFCGLSTLVMCLNALSIDPHRTVR